MGSWSQWWYEVDIYLFYNHRVGHTRDQVQWEGSTDRINERQPDKEVHLGTEAGAGR